MIMEYRRPSSIDAKSCTKIQVVLSPETMKPRGKAQVESISSLHLASNLWIASLQRVVTRLRDVISRGKVEAGRRGLCASHGAPLTHEAKDVTSTASAIQIFSAMFLHRYSHASRLMMRAFGSQRSYPAACHVAHRVLFCAELLRLQSKPKEMDALVRSYVCTSKRIETQLISR